MSDLSHIVANYTTVTSAHEFDDPNMPEVSALPSVFSNETVIKYHLLSSMPVSIKLYSLLGNEIAPIVMSEQVQSSGEHSVKLNLSGMNLPDGMYLLDFIAGKYKKTLKLIYAPE